MDCIIVAVNYSILRKLRFDAWSKVTSKADYALLTLVNTIMNNMIFSSHATTARWEVVHIERGFQQSQKCKSHYTNEDCKIPRFSKYI